jgi:hypothetical protein
MASTYSPSLRLELIGTGDQPGLWGDTTNNNLGDLIEQAITGVESIPMLDADYTLVALNGSVDEARNAVIIMTSAGALSGSRNVIIPAEDKLYVFKNSTTGGQNIVVKTSGGAGVTVPNGRTVQLYCDGTNCALNTDYLDSPVLAGTPIAPTATYGTNTTQLATTAFVQAALQALYPVGSVYTNSSVATNPTTLFGFGTWVAIGTGRVLIGQDTGDTAFDTLGETGGSKDAIVVQHTHIANSSSVSNTTVTDPGHIHSYNTSVSKTLSSGGDPNQVWGQGVTTANTTTSNTGITASTTTTTDTSVDATGSSGGNANLQPYVVVKMWTRTA